MVHIRQIEKSCLLPSAAYTLLSRQLKHYKPMDCPPKIGDVAYGRIVSKGQHDSLENKGGRIHTIYEGTKAIFVFGNRYAPDFYEGYVPDGPVKVADLLARSGVIGIVRSKCTLTLDPTKVEVIGYVCDSSARTINTLDYPMINPLKAIKRYPRAKLILVIGTAMNSGKSTAAAACCRVLSSSGYNVRASKITGTSSLKDILHMNDAGARIYTDFSHFGYPSTFGISEEELMTIFDRTDLKYANNPNNFWIVEIADGICQRETAMLLKSQKVTSRIHKLLFCASDAIGAVGGLTILRRDFGLEVDAISGRCTTSPLHIQEIRQHTSIPIFKSTDVDAGELLGILTKRKKASRAEQIKYSLSQNSGPISA